MTVIHTSLRVRQLLSDFLHEDIGSGDITTNNLASRNLNVRAEIIAKSYDEIVAAGIKEATIIFDMCNCNVRSLVKEGSSVKRGQAIMEIEGQAKNILKGERTALNLLMRMSGIATETKKLISAVRDTGSRTKISSTRKTCPGLRIFDKRAVMIGGGIMHRQRLDDMVLIKNNHVCIEGSVSCCIRELKNKCGSKVKIECEVTNMHDLIVAIREGADTVMLDNFQPKDAKDAIDMITRMGIRKNSNIEISGGISLSNIKDYAIAKPDTISVGYLTHSAKAVDYSLKIVS